MSVTLEGGAIVLRGDCAVHEAETLLGLMQGAPELAVDVTQAGHIHAALFQVLLARGARLRGPAADPFLRHFLAPLLPAATAAPATAHGA